jgi:hypothetical protein
MGRQCPRHNWATLFLGGDIGKGNWLSGLESLRWDRKSNQWVIVLLTADPSSRQRGRPTDTRPQLSDINFQTGSNIWSQIPEMTHSDWLTDWLTVSRKVTSTLLRLRFQIYQSVYIYIYIYTYCQCPFARIIVLSLRPPCWLFTSHHIGENWHNRATTSGGEHSITTEDGRVRPKHVLIECKKWMCYIDG